MPTRKIPDTGWIKTQCRHPEHNPPQFISLPAGLYEHECPSCSNKTVFRVVESTLQKEK